MKNYYKKAAFGFVLFASIIGLQFLIVGCGTLQTITPAQPAQTNAVTGAVTPQTPAVTTYIPNASVTQGIAYANQAVPYIPDPYKAPIEGGLALLAGITTIIAGIQNKNAAKHKAAAATLAAAAAQNPTVSAAAVSIAANNGTSGIVAEHLASANSPT